MLYCDFGEKCRNAEVVNFMPKFFEWKVLGLRVWHILLFVCLTFVYEIALILGFSVRDFILPWLAPSVAGVGFLGIIAAIIGNITNLAQIKKVTDKISLFITDKLQVTTIGGALFLILVLLIGPAHAAHFHPVGRVINALGNWDNNSDAEESVSPQEVPSSFEEFVPPESSPPLHIDAPPEKADPFDGVLVVPDELHTLESDSQLYLEIFFQSGDTPLTNWTAEEVEAYVCADVASRHQYALDPNFNEENTPQAVKDEIYRASKLDEKVQTLADQQEVIDIRLWVYSQYPEYRLPTLIREDYCTCGDAYVTRGLSLDTAVYYYAYSIHWGLEALEYNVSPNATSYDLSILAERYQKIANNTPVDSTLHRHAQLLADAFESISNSYS